MKFSDARDILPDGAITREEWDRPAAQWLHDMPWERAAVEAARLGIEHPTDAWVLSKIAEVEDQTDYYQLYLSAVRGLNRDDRKTSFKDEKWVPEELTHAVSAHALYDMALGNQVSGRHERNKTARGHMSKPYRAGSAILRTVVGNLAPDTLETIIYVKGFKNELAAQRYYQLEQDSLLRNGFPTLAEFLEIPINQEARHGVQYREFACEQLEGNPRLQKIVRFVMSRDHEAVGSEIRTAAETQAMVEHLGAVNPERLKRVATQADRLFQKGIPGMQGITPFGLAIAA